MQQQPTDHYTRPVAADECSNRISILGATAICNADWRITTRSIAAEERSVLVFTGKHGTVIEIHRFFANPAVEGPQCSFRSKVDCNFLVFRRLGHSVSRVKSNATDSLE